MHVTTLDALKLKKKLSDLGGSPYAGISIVLSVMLVLLMHQSRRIGLTIDEPSHFAASYSYWLGDDSLQPADTPPLTRLISGWIPRMLDVPSPQTTKGWAEKDAYVVGFELLGSPRGRRTLLLTRLPFLLVSFIHRVDCMALEQGYVWSKSGARRGHLLQY